MWGYKELEESSRALRENANQFNDNAKKVKDLAYKAMGYSMKVKLAGKSDA